MALTITTWNVQNLASGDDVFEEKIDFLASTLEGLGADIIALQEILDSAALDALAERLGFQQVAAEPDGRGNRVGFLTRTAHSHAENVRDWRLPAGVQVRRFDDQGNVTILEQLSRPPLKITVQHEGREIDIINAHLKSKLLTFGGNFSTRNETLRAHTAYFALERRAAEAATLREHATELLGAGRDLIVLGDFNDGPEAATTQMLYGKPGSQPRGPEDATHAAGAFQRADAGDAQRLFNVTKLVDEPVRWTRRHNGQNELLDQILCSAGLMPRSGGLRQVPSVTILNEDTPGIFGEHPTVSGIVPDHAPVTATFV